MFIIDTIREILKSNSFREMEQLEVLTPENQNGGTESRTAVQNSTGSRIRLVERRISKFEMQLQKMVIQKLIK